MKTSLGIWAFGGMATRFNPGGYKPELAGISTVRRMLAKLNSTLRRALRAASWSASIDPPASAIAVHGGSNNTATICGMVAIETFASRGTNTDRRSATSIAPNRPSAPHMFTDSELR